MKHSYQPKRIVLSLLYLLLVDLCILLVVGLIRMPFAIEIWAVINAILLMVVMLNRASDLSI